MENTNPNAAVLDEALESQRIDSDSVLQQGTQIPNVSDEYRNTNTFEIVTKVGFLLGVPDKYLLADGSLYDHDIYNEMAANRSSRIIRNLCSLRAIIERRFKDIRVEMTTNYKGLTQIPDIIPTQLMNDLFKDSVHLKTTNVTKLVDVIVDINRLINDRINNCRSFFPAWVNWEYIKQLFIMPDGLSSNGAKKEADKYYQARERYPYGVYMNWPAKEDVGNVLSSDAKFLYNLYEWNNDTFTERSRVKKLDHTVKQSISAFLKDSTNAILVVDCENSDPYRLCGVLEKMDKLDPDSKLKKIVLFNDSHASSAWDMLSQYTDIPIEDHMLSRVLSNKSRVDMSLGVYVCKERYKSGIDSFLIASSDSDYFSMVEHIDDARFLVLPVHGKVSDSFLDALAGTNTKYCFMDNISSVVYDKIRKAALIREVSKWLNSAVAFSLTDITDTALSNLRMELTDAEKKQFMTDMMNSLTFVIDKNFYAKAVIASQKGQL